MRVTITLTYPQHRDGEPERDLVRRLGEHELLKGRVQLVSRGSQAGAITDTILAIIAEVAGPSLAALSAVLISWQRHRTSDMRVVVRRPDGAQFEVDGRRIRGLGKAEVMALIEQLSATLADHTPTPSPPDG